ncbi:hypothetical protein [Nitrosophilus alvini]|uniref:hypothetical protein n=1 Tax=Nitrosophilus alvini TaxID=2714855 RepID=UPI00190B01DA|nr:hypothetical protein [Nitrosophilus alvini]
MVRYIFLFLIIISAGFGDILEEKIKSLVDKKSYIQHQKLIEKIFENRNEFYLDESHVDIVKVVQRLKENGLLKLFFNEPRKLIVTFRTNGYPLFFIKLVSDKLRELGYYYFLTYEARNEDDGFYWSISLTAEYAIDPVILSNALKKEGCLILDIRREDEERWVYTVDINGAYLDVLELEPNVKTKLKKPVSDYWLALPKGRKISIASMPGNSWYPRVAIYDKRLHLLKVYKKDEKTSWIVLRLPENAYYIKISDIYTLGNIKNGLKVVLE